ncbi:MAG TPA: ABC transporter ATP-binding protein [Anaerolineae bacterium]|nr:ABC transporter ATP-binding protein [Anaerolineae bacterium]
MTKNNGNTVPSGRPRIEHLELRGVTKRFPGVLANDRVDFDVRAGEVHALLGENGAGKSTLMKVLYGMYAPDEGEIWLNGQPVSIASPTDAITQGIGMIHQHFMLVESLTVAENVALGLPSSRGPLTDLDRVTRRIVELAEVYGLRVDPNAYIWQLAVGQKQRVEILKALYRGAALLILDEPTAVLTPQEVDEFFVTLRQMTRDGHAIIFISHKLHEVLAISNRVTVLRDGKRVDSCTIEGCTKQSLAQMMVGREVMMKPYRADLARGEPRLVLQNLHALSERETPALRGVNLTLHSGEILGLAGVSGNGQCELAQVITGLRPLTEGQVLLEGRDLAGLKPGPRTHLGLAYIPEERMKDGMIQDFSVAENMILRDHHKEPFSRRGFLLLRIIADYADRLIQAFRVKTPSRETPAKSLSGGNIQKVVLARELSRQPRVLIAAQPTRGVDIGATEYVHAQLLLEREKGTAILLISEDLDEVMALSDRIAVIYEGQIMGIVDGKAATPGQLGLLMAGVRE